MRCRDQVGDEDGDRKCASRAISKPDRARPSGTGDPTDLVRSVSLVIRPAVHCSIVAASAARPSPRTRVRLVLARPRFILRPLYRRRSPRPDVSRLPLECAPRRTRNRPSINDHPAQPPASDPRPPVSHRPSPAIQSLRAIYHPHHHRPPPRGCGGHPSRRRGGGASAAGQPGTNGGLTRHVSLLHAE